MKLILLSVTAVLVTGCSIRSYNSQAEDFYGNYKAGRSQEAVEDVASRAKSRASSVDALLWRLEEGAVRLAAEDFEGSLQAFETAESVIADYESRASVNARDVGLEMVSAVSNPTAIAYKGTAYDKIMVNTYKALAYLRKGDMDGAKVELRRAYTRQQEAVELYSKAIDETRNEGNKKGVSYEKAINESKDLGDMTRNYKEIAESHAYAVYVNPFTVYLDGLVHLATARDGSDLERAKKDFERVMGMVKASELLTPELKAVENSFRSKQASPSVYVIVEHGVAPIRKQVTLNFPTPHKQLRFVSNSFPVIRLQTAPYTQFNVNAGGTQLPLQQLASMDAIVVKEFQHQLPIMITRILINGALRAVAQYQAEKEAGLAGLIGSIAYNVVVNRSDLRTWLTLPKEFVFTRLDRPESGSLSLYADGQALKTIDLPQNAQMILVYFKIPAKGTVSSQTLILR